jgi:hypothetical protein
MYGRLGLEQAFIPGQGLKCPIKRKEKKEKGKEEITLEFIVMKITVHALRIYSPRV